MDKEYLSKKCKIMWELGFELIVLSDEETIFRRSTLIDERNMIVSYVNLITNELQLKDHLFLSDIYFQKKYDIPQSALENKDIFSDWLTGILKSVAEDIETSGANQERKQDELRLSLEQMERMMRNIGNPAN